MSDSRSSDFDEEQPPVRVTDKRRLDPESGELREGVGVPAPAPSSTGSPAGAEGEDPAGGLDGEVAAADPVTAELIERTEDLRRLKAEYDNYRRRVERDRAGWGELAVAKVVGDLLPALDDIDRARAHEALDGSFRAVADQVDKALHAAGLARFGAAGEAFDPARHEALTSIPQPDLETEQVVEVYRAGYEFAGRVLRAAQVVVGTPA